MVTNLTQNNIDPLVGGIYQCEYGKLSPKLVSDPITVTVAQKFVGVGPSKKSKREFLSFDVDEKISWFRTLTEDQHVQLLTQFGLSEDELYDLQQRGKGSFNNHLDGKRGWAS